MDAGIRNNKIVRIPLIALSWVGLVQFKTQRFARIKYLIGYWMTVHYMIRNISEIIFAYLNLDDLRIVTANSGTTAIHFSMYIKCVNCLIYRKEINEMYNSIFEDTKCIEEDGDEEEKVILENCANSFNKVLWFMQASIAFTCAMFINYFVVIFFILYEPGTEVHPLSVDIWFPFTRAEHNGIVFCTCTYFTILDALIIPQLNAMFISMLVYGAFRLKILQHKLRNREIYILKARNRKAQRSDKYVTKNEKVENVKNRRKNRQTTHDERFKFLVSRIEEHLRIIKYLEDMKKIIWIPMGVDFIIYILMYCGESVLFSKMPFGLQMITSLAYLVSITVLAFLYYWHATEIKYESTRLAFAAYESPWLNDSTAYRRALMLMIQMANQSVKLMAGLYPMDLGTFIMILRASYSVYSIMRQFG